MPENWSQFVQGYGGGALAVFAGAIMRVVLGHEQWNLREFLLTVFAGIAFMVWVAPWIVEVMGWGPAATNGLCLGFGMVAKPVAHGVIKLAKGFADNPEKWR